jgi:hypothetical protein
MIEYKPVSEQLTRWDRFKKRLHRFGFCSYCGQRYGRIVSTSVGLFTPLGGKGKACPDGHEGYVEFFNIGGWHERHEFDSIKERVDSEATEVG